jgi:hypothetical protein
LTNIANPFTPQPETIALYPFLGTPNLNLNTHTAQPGLTTFINSLYQNLYVHAPDTAGRSYWVGQITAGVVGLGAAALAIANGAAGSDAIEVRNKLAAAPDFSNQTTTAVTPPYPASFVTSAASVLNNIDGTSLDEASVTSEMNATTAYITSATTTHGTALAASAAPGAGSAASSDPDVITVTGAGQLNDPGTGNHTIQFLPVASSATVVLHENSMDQVYSFDPNTDVLDLRSLLNEANINLNDSAAALGNYLNVTGQNAMSWSNSIRRVTPEVAPSRCREGLEALSPGWTR